MTSILDAFRRIIHALRVAGQTSHARVGLTAAQLFVLHKLDGRSATSLNELAALTHTHQSSVSVVVQRLVERGLVERAASPVDRRRLELRLTPAGQELMHHAPDPAQDQLIAAIGQLAPSQRHELAETLHELTQAMPAAREQPSMFFEESSARRGKPTHHPSAATKGIRRNAQS